MKNKIYLTVIFILSILALTKSSSAQIRFEVDLPGIRIVAGEPYYYVISQPRIIYYEPLPPGYYYYDKYNNAYYDDYGCVYYYPTNVYIKRDNGKHKGWYKKRHKHDRDDDDDYDDD